MGIFWYGILPTIRLSMRNIVGPRVRQARKMAKPTITQIDLVARLQIMGLKVDQSAVSKIEKGVRPVLDVEVVALAKALRVSPAWLLGEKDATISAGQG